MRFRDRHQTPAGTDIEYVVLARRDLWEEGIVRALPVPHVQDLVAGGPPWRFESAPVAPSAPLPGADTDALRESPASFWRSS